VPADAKANVEEPLAELKKALEGTDVAAIKTSVEKVATASQALGAALYQQQASAPSDQPAGDQPQSGDEDVVDAEIIDEDEQK
jgi:molecular chaperone DnaK